MMNGLKTNSERETSSVLTDDRKTIKSCIKKIKRCLKEYVKFEILYDTKKMSLFCFAKDKIPIKQNANTVYQFTCPGYSKDYTGRTDMLSDTYERAWNKN